jgi:hypothetical protein
MTAPKRKRPAAGRAAKAKSSKSKSSKAKSTKAKSSAPLELRVALKGDKLLAENVIAEVLAAARRMGLEPPKVEVLRKPRIGPKRLANRKSR